MEAQVPLALRDLRGIGTGLVNRGDGKEPPHRVSRRPQPDGVTHGKPQRLGQRAFESNLRWRGRLRGQDDGEQQLYPKQAADSPADYSHDPFRSDAALVLK